MKATRAASLAVRGAAALAAAPRLAAAASRRPPVTPAEGPVPSISVVVPARDEVRRIGPLLEAVVGARGVEEVLVVDDRSTDGTAVLAGRLGATVVPGAPLPRGWVGKAWALDQGLRAASGEWVVALDADARPSPHLPRALVARAVADGLDLVSAAGRFDCPSAPLRLLHPAMLATLLYRAAPPGAARPGPVFRRMANGQCVALHRATMIGAGGLAAVGHHSVEDVALFRAMATAGFAVDFLDATGMLTVRMYESAAEAWRGWGRSLALPGVDRPARQVADAVVVGAAQALPLVRLVARRGDRLDVVLAVVRAGVLAGTARAYAPRGLAYWLSPLADGAAALALAAGIVRRRHRWRGREYGRSGTAAR